MHDNKIIEAIQTTGRLNKAESRTLEVLYKTSINNESDASVEFLRSKLNNCTKAYISKIINSLEQQEFISFKLKKGSSNQVYILNREKLDLLVQSLELREKL